MGMPSCWRNCHSEWTDRHEGLSINRRQKRIRNRGSAPSLAIRMMRPFRSDGRVSAPKVTIPLTTVKPSSSVFHPSMMATAWDLRRLGTASHCSSSSASRRASKLSAPRLRVRGCPSRTTVMASLVIVYAGLLMVSSLLFLGGLPGNPSHSTPRQRRSASTRAIWLSHRARLVSSLPKALRLLTWNSSG